MKDKILKAIDKGLMNVLSPDIKDQDIDFNHGNIDNEYVPCEYRTVDMGTGVLWCEYNLGAFPGNKHSDWYGDYYAWGETETKDEYSPLTYQYCTNTIETLTKYNEQDNLTVLEPCDDVVAQTLGDKFRMPTYEDFKKLFEITTSKKVTNHNGIPGLNGILFTAENGNTLFFPAAGYYDKSNFDGIGNYGMVWSASVIQEFMCGAYALCFDPSDDISIDDGDYRYRGASIRGVAYKSIKNIDY